MELKIITLQYALFFRDRIERPDIEFRSLNESMLNLFDAIPRILPVPSELPSDIPILSLSSDKKNYLCNVARSRIDLRFERQDDEKTNTEILKGFLFKGGSVLKICYRASGHNPLWNGGELFSF